MGYVLVTLIDIIFFIILISVKVTVTSINKKLDKIYSEIDEKELMFMKLRDSGVITTVIMNKAIDNSKLKNIESVYEKELLYLKEALIEIKQFGLIDESEYEEKNQMIENNYNNILGRQ